MNDSWHIAVVVMKKGTAYYGVRNTSSTDGGLHTLHRH